jgi:DUF1680 family protein
MGIHLRIPYWAQGGNVKINGQPLAAFGSPSSYLVLNRTWKTGDTIELNLPMALHVDSMPDDETVQAMMYGPLVLAGRFDPVTKEMMYSDSEPKSGDQIKVADITAATGRPTGWLEADLKQPLTFHTVGQAQSTTLVPLYQIINDRYAVYWKVNSKSS